MQLYLLDSIMFLWWITDDKRLGNTAKVLIGDSRNRVALSAASIWELARLIANGLVIGITNVEHLIEDEGFEVLAIDGHHSELAGKLEDVDYVEGVMIAQAQSEGAIIITSNKIFGQNGIRTCNALI